MMTLEGLARSLADGKRLRRGLVEEALAAMRDPSGEGARAFIAIDEEGAKATARSHRRPAQSAGGRPRHGRAFRSPSRTCSTWQGEVTTAGSVVLADSPPAGSRRAGDREAEGGRLHRGRAHQHDRIRLFGRRPQSALRHARRALRARQAAHPRRIVVGCGGRGRRRHGGRWPSAPTPADRAGSRPPFAASSDSSRARAHLRPAAPIRCRPPSIRSVRWPTRSPRRPSPMRSWRATGMARSRCARHGPCASAFCAP